jgi:hypothetical protein
LVGVVRRHWSSVVLDLGEEMEAAGEAGSVLMVGERVDSSESLSSMSEAS